MVKEFDLVLFGATGFVGRQATAYLTAHAPAGLRWAVAGRDPRRLAQLGAAVPAVVADAGAPEQLAALAARTRVVLNVGGPFKRSEPAGRSGDPLVAACIAAGAHYCDISGEASRVSVLVDRHDDDARSAGVRIVPFCGVSSLPVDLGVLLLDRELGGELSLAKAALDVGGGMLNGGTVAGMIDAWDSGEALADRDPFLLGPDRRPDPVERDPRGLRYDRDLRTWVAASPMGLSDTRAVRFSATLTGRDVRFQEYLAYPGAAGAFRTAAVRAALSGFDAAVRWRPTRRVVGRLVPPGRGPTPKQMDGGYLRMRLWGRDDAGRTAGLTLDATGDPANRITVVCACESALMLTRQESDRCGVLTPSVAFGADMAVRLRAAGMRIG